MKISADQIRKLREQTGAPVIRVKKVLEEVEGNDKKAFEILSKEGFEKVAKREGRETSQGIIETYTHHSKRVGSVIELFCETDFVGRNETFLTLAHDLALQLASNDAKNAEELLKQDFIKDPAKKVADLIKEVIAKTGENVRLGRIYRIELGK
jgi:elongation factor Ts